MTRKTIVSAVCRADLSAEILSLVTEPGKIEIPHDLLPSRQIKLEPKGEGSVIPAALKWHRDGYVAALSRYWADWLVAREEASYVPQYLLTYSRADYIADPDVIAMPEELERATNSLAELVVVAVIGDNRSAHSVCRNIVSGCQDMGNLAADAKGAIEAASLFLVED
jgi:hypothetical protein